MSNSDNKQNTMVPKLRFPEFESTGIWKNKSFNEIAHFYKGKGVSKADISLKGSMPCIRYGELYTHYNEVINDVISKTNLQKEELFLSKKNDVIIPSSGETKWDIARASCVMLDNIALGGDLNVIRSKENGIFISYYLNGIKKTELSKIAQGDTVAHLYSSQLKLIELLVPPKNDEQQKIADCLSSVDELITVQEKKIDSLQKHKKGLLQQLFPDDGTVVPNLRFPEFLNAHNWFERKLNNICSFVRGPFGGSLKKEIFVKEGYAVYEQSHAIYQNFNSFRYYISEEKFNELKRFAVRPNEIIMSCSGTMGKFAIIPENAKAGVINQALLKLSVKNNYNLLFIKMSLEHPINQEKLLSKSAGGVIKNVVSVELIKELDLFVPDLKEQQKIADCLSSLDELISLEIKKLELFKIHKKGLMQQLFPSMDEVS